MANRYIPEKVGKEVVREFLYYFPEVKLNEQQKATLEEIVADKLRQALQDFIQPLVQETKENWDRKGR